MKLFFYELYKLFRIKIVSFGLVILTAIGILSAVALKPNGIPEGYEVSEDFLKYVNILSFEEENPLTRALNEYEGQKPGFDSGVKALGEYFRYTDYSQKADEAIKGLEISKPLNVYYRDDFLKRSLQMRIDKYEALKETVNKKSFFPFGIELLTKNNIAALVTLLSVVLASLFVSCNDKQSGMSTLIFTTKKGRLCSALTKISAIFALSVFSVITISVPILLIGEHRFSLGDLSCSIQSLDGFLYSTLDMTIGEYLTLFILMRIFTLFLIGAFIFLVSSVFKSVLSVIITAVSVGAAEVLLYYSIPDNSVFNVAKRMNVVALYDTNSLLSNEAVISLSGVPVLLYCAAMLLLVVMIIAVLTGCLLLSLNIRSITGKKSRIISRLLTLSEIVTIRKNSDLVVHEMYKTCFTNKALALSILAIIISLLSYNSFSVPYDNTDYVYRKYVQTNGGKVDESTMEFIEVQKEYFSNIQTEYSKAQEKGDYQQMDKLQTKLQDYDGFLKYARRAESIYNSTDENVQLIYETGFEKLIGTENNFTDCLTALIAVFAAMIFVLPTYASDNKNGILSVISATVHGRRRLYAIRSVISLLLTIIIFITVYSPQLFFILKNYVAGGYDANVKSLEVMTEFSFDMTISQYLITLYIVRFVALCIISMLLLAVSVNSKNLLFGLLKATGIIILPIALAMIVPQASSIWLTAYICGNAGMEASVLNLVMTILVVIGLCGLFVKKSRYPVTE